VVASAPEPRREFELGPSDNARLANLCGPLDENLRLLEKRLDVRIHRRGDTFRVSGAQAAHAENLLRELFALTQSEDITPERVHLALRERESGLPAEEDTREHGVRVPRGGIRARGAHQRSYLEHIRTRDLTFGIGPAGTGKTYLAVAAAVDLLMTGRVERIILSRPAVEAGERLGFLPGDLRDKVDPYLRPIFDALNDMVPADQLARRLGTGEIEVAPIAFMRGRTLSRAFVILDEAQNTTPVQMKMFLTRLGEASRMVVTGDSTQVDLPAGTRSGLTEALETLSGVEGIATVHLTDRDVVRHELVARIVRAYEARERAVPSAET
jgi:phosphate starvation-inducible protein PhoH and related proteins